MSQFLEILRAFCAAWVNPTLRPTALKVAVVVGSVLFTINHGAAVARGEMTRDHWVSGLLTYLVPYTVSIHGQFVASSNTAPNFFRKTQD